ncbi:MAG: tetratricopeptide repeat protein [SAR86 cluster bacterium]
MYYSGKGVPQDYAEALKLFRLSAKQVFAGAQYNLGIMYLNGKGVLQDDVLAHMWFNIAGANGDADGSENRGKLEKRMTFEQITDAQELARRCIALNYQVCE